MLVWCWIEDRARTRNGLQQSGKKVKEEKEEEVYRLEDG